MWPSFTSSFSNKDKMKTKQPSRRNLNINDEYLSAVRTKSYADFFLQVQLLVNDDQQSDQNPTHCHPSSFSEILLNPDQETITSLLESSNLSKKQPLSNYFDISAEASNLCSHVITCLIQLQSNYKFINKTINSINPDGDDDLRSRAALANPFSDLNKQQVFKKVQEKHSVVLQQLRSNRKRAKRKIKALKFFSAASRACVAAACGAAAAVAVLLAAHTLAALLVGPALLLGVPVKPLKRKMRNLGFLKKYGRRLRRATEQLDAAAKGAYILKRDFDTIGRLVVRMEDEVEHDRAMIELCLERREDRHCVQMLKELKKYEFGMSEKAAELEEHVFLCLVTINRARAMVVREICRNSGEDSVQ